MSLAQATQVGAIFDNGVGARALAMGKAQTALFNDGYSLYWNPAGLSQLKYPEFNIERDSHFSVLSSQYLAASLPLYNLGVGLGYFSSGIGDIWETTVDGDDTGNRFSYAASSIMLGVGSNIKNYIPFTWFPSFYFGSTLKFLSQSLYSKSAKASVIDVGALYIFSPEIQFGLSIENILKQSFKWNTDSKTKEVIPQRVKLGLSYKDDGPMLFSLDLRHQSKKKAAFNFGSELLLYRRPNIQLHSRFGLAGDNFTFGIGLFLAGFGLDYSYQFSEKLYMGNTHFLSLNYKWGYKDDYDYDYNRDIVDIITRTRKQRPIPMGVFTKDRQISTQNIAVINTVISQNIVEISSLPTGNMSLPSENVIVLIKDGVSPMVSLASQREIPDSYNFYQDLTNHWVRLAAEEFHLMGFINGTPIFNPDKAITRVEYAQLAMTVFGIEKSTTITLDVADVPLDTPYSETVQTMLENGFFMVDDNNNFRPLEFITRAEAVAVILRISQLDYDISDLEFPFEDVNLDHWARFYVEVALHNDLILFEDKFYPKRILTRSEMVAIFSRTPEIIKVTNERLYSE